ncbi:hypothetical protein SMICM304S_05482 [Streptomyces microflavus]
MVIARTWWPATSARGRWSARRRAWCRTRVHGRVYAAAAAAPRGGSLASTGIRLRGGPDGPVLRAERVADGRGTPRVFAAELSRCGCPAADYGGGRGIARHGAKMVTAVACTRVPKLRSYVGGSYGAGHYSMCGRATRPAACGWRHQARPGSHDMGGEQAASVRGRPGRARTTLGGAGSPRHEDTVVKVPVRRRYETRGQRVLRQRPARGDDGVIDPDGHPPGDGPRPAPPGHDWSLSWTSRRARRWRWTRSWR